MTSHPQLDRLNNLYAECFTRQIISRKAHKVVKAILAITYLWWNGRDDRRDDIFENDHLYQQIADHFGCISQPPDELFAGPVISVHTSYMFYGLLRFACV